MTIEGYGRATEKAVIHALERLDNGVYVTLCSKIPMINDIDLNIMQVSCGNCKRLKAYTDAITEAIESPKKKETSTIIVDTEKSEVIDIEININIDEDSLKKDMPKLREVFSERVSNLEEQFIAASRENGTYDIIHRLSNIVFFGAVPKHHLTSCLLMLNSSLEGWTGRTAVRKEWIENIKKLFLAGRVFANESSYDDYKTIDEKDKIIESQKQQIEGLNAHNDLLIQEQESLKKDILRLNDKLKIANELVVMQQYEINQLVLSEKTTKIEPIKSSEEKEKPKIKKYKIMRLKN